MSRAFTKEDDSLEVPIIPPRAALPPGTTNYVTPAGLEQLRQELTQLEVTRTAAEANRDNAADRTRRLTVLNGQLSALNDRIASARVVEPAAQPAREVRFGACVTLRPVAGQGPERQFAIVGVDEADVAAGKIAFVAPIARAVQGARLGQRVHLRLGSKTEEVEVISIAY
ncbi:GreA/GreB family elongation factor [Hymenobacter rubripertinctus]|uniref:Transcription elongation factor GreAB n=1 Tax=Hymenobacter rubripertinctus TaxID=2029981 RepID=A0A418R2H1_9BACT|nr:GreA/GreB family elongation factor [Hymenobacter rubripertinctus]RIY11551.1 transcription elongation factor GreAB [Hymenobacter rubripertinctus]